MPRRPSEGPAAGAAGVIPLAAVVTHATVQLYLEEVRPKARVLQWMVIANTGVCVELEALLRACRSAPGLLVEGEERRISKWIVKLPAPPSGFQRFTDGLDEPIPESIYQDVALALSSGGWSTECHIDHQSFEIAAWLKTRAGLSHLSLGRAMSIVRQGLHVYWLLGKSRDRLVPFGASEECERHSNVLAGLPTGVAPGERYVATWAGLRRCLAVLLRERGGSLPAAGLKQAFRARFGAELSETPFGYTSVAMLVRSPQLSQLASVMPTPGQSPTACTLELRPDAVDCPDLDLADAFAVCRYQDPTRLALMRQEVASSMAGLAGGRSTGWRNPVTLPYPAHLGAALPGRGTRGTDRMLAAAHAAHRGRPYPDPPPHETPRSAGAAGASPAASHASSSSGAQAPGRLGTPLRLQLSKCLVESPGSGLEGGRGAAADPAGPRPESVAGAGGAPWWMCPPTSPARGPLQPRAGAPAGQQQAAPRAAKVPAGAAGASDEDQLPVIKENLAPPPPDVDAEARRLARRRPEREPEEQAVLPEGRSARERRRGEDEVPPSSHGPSAAAAAGVPVTPPPKDQRSVAFSSPACYDSPPAFPTVTRSSALSTASSPSPLPNWCSVRHTFIEAQIQPDEDEWPVVTTSRSKSSPPQFQ